MNSGRENRRSFRIRETVYLKYEVISDREFHQGLDRRKIRLGASSGIRSQILDLDTRFAEKLFLLKGESSRVAECLALLNDKLNTVIEQFPDLRASKASLASSEPQTCEVGADGMIFATDKPYAAGTKLALRFLLAADNRYIETFCNVVRDTEPVDESDPAKPFAVAVEFQGMKPAQKEILIQHLFNRESETLRMRRLNIEAMS
ncbi:MAG: hypothetical protein OEW68_00375 [Gammaproteobacteria bacterium]|nr:hypothetical protein [Gammaproteobacteria bacterium]MDH4313278.1 hypothetical protein [Gammaproteobacteria bacterium]MDH5212921.1 hypothetical protein [Gammaproteobacteria bacterium]MDH5499472.1 hypothetical protein [Gammaproteobacteria bacterium]